MPAHALLGIGLGASTQSAANVTSSSATLRGSVSPLSLSTAYYFDVGPTTAYGTQTPVRYVSSLLSSQTVQASLTGLKPGTTYHYRIVAGEGLSVARGSDMTFKTASANSGPGSGGSGSGSGSGTGTGTSAGDQTSTPTGDDPTSTSGDSSGGSDSSSGDFPAEIAPPMNVTPVLGESIAATPAAGDIRVRVPGSAMFVPLEGDASLPVGTTLDARRGTVSLLAARDANGATQPAQFQGAVFKVGQGASKRGITDIYLKGGDFRPCWPATARGVVSAARARTVRRLWGRDRGGRFRTHGQRAVATVRGTTWAVADRCDGTLTKVAEGAVSVRDKVRRKTVLVKAGHSYLARARR